MADLDAPQAPDSADEIEHCYRHPREETGVHCTRCGRPICPECMVPASVGHHCPQCVADARKDARLPLGRRARGTAMRLGRPGGVTAILIAANLAMYVAEIVFSKGAALGLGVTRGGQSVVPTLIDMGGLSPVLVASGEWWRTITAMFLHVNLIHVALNCLILYQLGNAVEGTFGRTRMITIYLVGGFLASVTSYTFSNPGIVAAGASGAVFALAGAWLSYHWRRRDLAWSASQVQSIFIFLGMNVLFGLGFRNIDQFAHLGGFLAGIAAGVIADGFGPPAMRNAVRVGGFVALVALGIGVMAFRTSQLCTQEVLGVVVSLC